MGARPAKAAYFLSAEEGGSSSIISLSQASTANQAASSTQMEAPSQ